MNFEDMTCNEMVEQLAEVRDMIQALKDQAADLESRIVELAESDSWVIDRIGFVEVRYGSRKTTWDTDLLWSAGIEHGRTHRSLNPDTGEASSEAESVGRALRGLLGKTPNFTKGGVSNVGLEPELFSEVGPPARSTIKIVSPS